MDNRGSFASTPYVVPGTSADRGGRSLGTVKSRINTGRSSESNRQQSEAFMGHQSASASKKMSFKQRRDSYKELTTGKNNLDNT